MSKGKKFIEGLEMLPPHFLMRNLLGNIRLLSGLIVISLIVALNLHTEQIFKWSNVPATANVNVNKEVSDKLGTLEHGDHVGEGAVSEVLQLQGAARNSVNLYVAEVDFTASGMDGIDHWRKDLLAHGALLVNSSDEFRRNDGGMSKSVAAGCSTHSLNPLTNFPDQIGSVFLEPCNKPYRSENINSIAHATIVTWGTEGDIGLPACVRSPLDADKRYSTDPGYLSCVTGGIKSALSDLFYRRKEVRDGQTLLLPALGTGAGAVQPNAVYDVYQKTIYEFLSNPDLSRQLPQKLVFLLSRHWTPDEWRYHRFAIANMVSGLHDRWSIFSGKYRQTGPIESLLGVLLGLILIAVAVIARTPLVPPRLFALSEGKLTLTLIGWGLGAFGLITALQAILTPIVGVNFSSEFGTEINIGLGIAAVLAATFIFHIEDVFKDLIKEGHGRS